MAASWTQQETILRMFDKIICSDRIIKSQQRDDPELTKEQKTEILSAILHNSPGSFLTRFGSLFDQEDLSYFVNSTDYEVIYHTKELQTLLKHDNRKKRTNNRRYKAIEELTCNGSYFTEQEMRERCPLLYEQYIGQFLSDEERTELESCRPGELSLAAHITNKLDNDIIAEKLVKELQLERDKAATCMVTTDLNSVLTVSTDPQTAEQDKYVLRKEFLRLMHLRFLNGEDDYDYRTIDNNEDYDVSNICQRDHEETYFDSEEPNNQINTMDNIDDNHYNDDDYDY